MDRFGANIAFLRKKLGWSQEDLAKKLGVQRTTISNYEKGISMPPYKTLKKIVALFGVDMHRLTVDDLSIEPVHEERSSNYSIESVALDSKQEDENFEERIIYNEKKERQHRHGFGWESEKRSFKMPAPLARMSDPATGSTEQDDDYIRKLEEEIRQLTNSVKRLEYILRALKEKRRKDKSRLKWGKDPFNE